MTQASSELPKPIYGDGVYHRNIRITSNAETVLAELEDDFHHFRLRLRHDGEKVVEVEGEAFRFPWTTCSDATGPLRALRGLRLSQRCTSPAREHDPRSHCTHLFDLAGLALTHAASGRKTRLYEIHIPDRVDKRTRATILRDGVEILAWALAGRKILGPPPFDGRSLTKGFVEWADAEFEPEMAEAAIILRRACAISLGRAFPLDHIPNASDMAERTLGACYSFSPAVIEIGKRVVGSTLDFTDTPERLLSGEPHKPSTTTKDGTA